jgi:membrane peptidoglycan carboxypeptidase
MPKEITPPHNEILFCLYDRTGQHLLYEIHGTQRRTLVELKDIPSYAIKATIAIEDKTFYEHQGFNLPRIIKSILVDLVTGSKAQGGSTLTQQFVKNAILSNEKAISRKIKELVLSYQIEQKFSKDDILKLYFNEIPYGSTAYGIESASGIYFGKSAKDLTLAEAAILAALPQAPSYYSPYGPHKDDLINRQHLVLKLMREQGYITSDQEKQADAEKIVFKTKREDITAPHFVFMVKSQLAERYGDRLVEQGGLKITTTLDWEKQQLAQQTVDELTPQLKDKYGANNTGLVTIDVESGDVLALIGSKDFFDDSIDGQVNVATANLQPGSSFKPFVYAEAFTKGYNPQTVLVDAETSFSNGGTDYRPRNYDGKEYGPVSIRQALAGSLNVPAQVSWRQPETPR